jgi:ferredoxin
MVNNKTFEPDPVFLKKFPDISGNRLNGLGETKQRRPSPSFWHKPQLQPFGELQQAVIDYHRRSPAIANTYSPTADRGPRAIDISPVKIKKPEKEWTEVIKNFVLENEGDLVGIVRLDPMWIYEGFEIKEPWLIMIGVAMNHKRLNQAPASFEKPDAAVEVGEKYNQAARVCRKLVNYILDQGYVARAFQGPFATALNMIPAAIEAGFGELGKHGSMINRKYGSNFRLSAISTDMPLLADQPDAFGADWFCHRCQACAKACPPDAISSGKQIVRGDKKWYVDFDKCIPYFGETLGCGICIARCPWSTLDRAPRLVEKWASKK